MNRRVLLLLAVALAATAVLLAVSGGFRTTVGGFRVSAQSPADSVFAALALGAIWFVLARRQQGVRADLEAAWHVLERNSSRLIGAIALSAAIVAATFATRSAAGADASGYLSQAAAWSDGLPLWAEPLAGEATVFDGWITTPLGWRPVDWCDACEGAQVPTYPPGLPLLMAVPHALAGIDGANAVIIASAAIAVWSTGMLVGGIAGMVAALLIAFSPVFLYQSFQPMSDVPVTAAWLLCFLLISRSDKPWASILAGIACAVAVLIRPNLAPLALVPLFMATRKVAFAVPVAVAGVLLALVQSFWYGSPLRSGYGSADELFALSNVFPNAVFYSKWLIATAPVLLLAPLGFVRARNDRNARALVAFAALVIAAYLIYAVFDVWAYLRFLLPAMAVFAVFAAIEVSSWIQRVPASVRAPLLFTLVLGVTAHGLWVARSLDAFRLVDQLRRVSQVAEAINKDVPTSAVILSGEQSGSMRYYTHRPILRWEAATPESLTAAVATLEQSNRPLLIVLDAWENEPFMNKFKSVPEVSLDWPPAVDAGMSHRTRVWNLSDRARFLKGEHIATIRMP